MLVVDNARFFGGRGKFIGETHNRSPKRLYNKEALPVTCQVTLQTNTPTLMMMPSSSKLRDGFLSISAFRTQVKWSSGVAGCLELRKGM